MQYSNIIAALGLENGRLFKNLGIVVKENYLKGIYSNIILTIGIFVFSIHIIQRIMYYIYMPKSIYMCNLLFS